MIEFDDAKGMSLEEIAEIELFTKNKLPQNVVDLFTLSSGGRMKDNLEYFINWNTKTGIELDTWIVGVETKDSIKSNWKNRSYLNDYLDWYDISKSYVDIDRLFPIFELVDGAVYISIGGKHNRKIYYADNGENGILNIALSLEEFYGKLSLFELSTGKIVSLT